MEGTFHTHPRLNQLALNPSRANHHCGLTVTLRMPRKDTIGPAEVSEPWNGKGPTPVEPLRALRGGRQRRPARGDSADASDLGRRRLHTGGERGVEARRNVARLLLLTDRDTGVDVGTDTGANAAKVERELFHGGFPFGGKLLVGGWNRAVL